MPALLDVNVLFALNYSHHEHHVAAVSWSEGIASESDLVVCRIAQLGLLRLLNNPAIMGFNVQNGTKIWRLWDDLLSDRRFRYAEEPETLDDHFRVLTGAFSAHPKRWQDAYLAAFALASDIELVTFDAGFRSFPGLRHRILASESLPPPN